MKCTKCNEEKLDLYFSWRGEGSGKRHTICKVCVNKMAKKYYLKDKQKYKIKAARNNKLYIARNKEFINEYLQEHPCVDCGESDPIVLDFDHVRGTKSGNVSRMKLDSLSLDSLKEEMDKCEIRCANCHRRITASRRGSNPI